MVLEKLGDSLKSALSKIAHGLFVDEKVLNELIKELQRALLQSDVNVKLVFDLTNKIKERVQKEQTPAGLTKKEHLINVVYEELVKFLGGEIDDFKIPEKKPVIIMMVGLFGSGKTTTTGKLAKYFMKRGKKVALVGLDIYRPAAMEQLMQVGKQINASVYIDKVLKDPIEIYESVSPNLGKYDVVLVDTAGRDAIGQDLIDELNNIHSAIQPDEIFLVISADIGQAAQKLAKTFHDNCGITGVVITKMDGTAKGGGALSACAITGAPIRFIGIGEKVDDLDLFKPKGFVGRLLGMGDLESLLEKAKEAITEEDAKDMEKKLMKGDFSLLDLYSQMEAMSKMGSLGKIMEMIPGMGTLKLPKDALQVQEGKLKLWKVAMNSMTKAELEDPELLNSSRIDRISKGSGISAGIIRELIKQYRESKKLLKMMKGGSPDKLMKKLTGGKR